MVDLSKVIATWPESADEVLPARYKKPHRCQCNAYAEFECGCGKGNWFTKNEKALAAKSELQAALLQQQYKVLEAAKAKLECYFADAERRNGGMANYVGGPTYPELMRSIDAALSLAQQWQAKLGV